MCVVKYLMSVASEELDTPRKLCPTCIGIRVPVLLQVPANTHAFVGESFMLQCTGDEYTLGYRWLKDGVELVTSKRVLLHVGEGLWVQNASREDAGNYTCVASSREGETRASAAVDITGPVLTCEGR